MIYLLARQFSPLIAFPCMVSLTFMTYHICLSQDGRAYSLLMFLGMLSLYFLLQYLKTLKKRYLVFTSFVFATVILHELQFYPVYFLFSDPMVLSSKWK